MIVGIYGAGGFGREVAPLLRMTRGGDADVRLITDETFEEFVAEGGTEIVVAIADAHARARLTRKCIDAGLQITQVVSPHALILDRVSLGRGAIVCSFAHLTSDIQIGEGFQANIYSYVGHDATIGDFVTLAPKASINGNVCIGDFSYIGTGAIIRQGLRIGRNVTVGMGAVVTKDIPDGETWFGNPARPRDTA